MKALTPGDRVYLADGTSYTAPKPEPEEGLQDIPVAPGQRTLDEGVVSVKRPHHERLHDFEPDRLVCQRCGLSLAETFPERGCLDGPRVAVKHD